MTTKLATAKLLDAAIAWHASTELTGKRPTAADQAMRRAVCRFLKAKSSPRKR